MDVSIIYKNLLKAFIICLSVVCYNVARVEAGNGTGLSPEMQAVRTWFEQKRQSLGIKHPTADEKRQIEAAKKEWDQKSKTMTDDDYYEAYDAWDASASAAWARLNPSTSSDADVIAADSSDYIYSEIDAYARNLGGQVKDKSDQEQDVATDTPAGAANGAGAASAETTPAAETPATEMPATVTQTVTTNENGNITEETSTNYIKGGEGTGATQTADAGEDDDAKTDDTKKPEEKKEEEKPAEEQEQYTGIYKDRQLIPDAMAAHCKINAEDIVKDMSRLEGCIRQYVTEMNNDNAAEANEGKRIYNVLRYNALNDALKKGISKAVAVNSYEDTMNNYAEASAEGETEFDSEANITNTLAFVVNVQNSIRDIAVENLRLEAINGFKSVDPAAFADDEKSEKAKSVEEEALSADSVVTSVETEVALGDGALEGGELGEVTVTGNQNGAASEGNNTQNTEQATEQETPKETRQPDPVDESDAVAKDLAGRSDEDLNHLYEHVKNEQEELSDTIFQMKQIKEKWQKQNKWTENDEAQLRQKETEYKEMKDYQKKIEKEMQRRG